MLRAEVFPISACPTSQLAIMPRPRAGDWLEDEIASWKQQGLHFVLSLLEETEIAELGLEAEAENCEKAEMRYFHFPIPDRGVPSSTQAFTAIVAMLVSELLAGNGVGIHCRMGIGRAACLSVCVLCALGLTLEAAWTAVGQARGTAVPDTTEQLEWVAEWVRTQMPTAG
jgi:protein-tyrosine phosphatase